MSQCQCLKASGEQCKNKPSQKFGANPNYCWSHQNCQKPIVKAVTQVVKPDIPKIPIQKKTAPVKTNTHVCPPIYVFTTASGYHAKEISAHAEILSSETEARQYAIGMVEQWEDEIRGSLTDPGQIIQFDRFLKSLTSLDLEDLWDEFTDFLPDSMLDAHLFGCKQINIIDGKVIKNWEIEVEKGHP